MDYTEKIIPTKIYSYQCPGGCGTTLESRHVPYNNYDFLCKPCQYNRDAKLKLQYEQEFMAHYNWMLGMAIVSMEPDMQYWHEAADGSGLDVQSITLMDETGRTLVINADSNLYLNDISSETVGV